MTISNLMRSLISVIIYQGQYMLLWLVIVQLLSAIPNEIITLTPIIKQHKQILFTAKRIINHYILKISVYYVLQCAMLCWFRYYSTAFCVLYSQS